MIRRRAERIAFGAVLIALAPAMAGAAAPAEPFPPSRSLVPFVKEADIDCDWMIHDPKEKWIRGGIGQGDDDPVIDFVDQAFDSWSDSEDHAIEISVGDPKRRVAAKAWASNAGGQTPGSIGFTMTRELRQLIGGASSLQVWKNGAPVFNTLLAGTPSAAELDNCVRPPPDPATDDSE